MYQFPPYLCVIMAVKQQSKAFRNIDGIKYVNYADLAQDEIMNSIIVADAKKLYKLVRIIKNVSFGFDQVFVAKPMLPKDRELVITGTEETFRILQKGLNSIKDKL